jgi:hypothetical protein
VGGWDIHCECKLCGGVGMLLHSFLNVALDGEASSRPGHISPLKSTLCLLNEGLVGPHSLCVHFGK